MLRITVAAVDETVDTYYDDGSLIPRKYPASLHTQRADQPGQPTNIAWGDYTVRVETTPLRVSVRHSQRGVVQELAFHPEVNQVRFQYGDAPVYGLGPGTHPLDRRGTKDTMRNGAGDDLRLFGARNPIPWLMGNGWGLYFHLPTGQFDLTGDAGVWHPSDVARAQDIFLVVGETPAELLREYAELTGYPHLPARWTLGFQQSHRTLESRQQILDEARTFREKDLPCDTMIYLGTGFCPSGWNTGHGSFVFNQAVFPDPEQIVKEFHALHFNIALHVVNPPETLHGTVQDSGAAASVPGDAANYWAQHEPLVRMGIDGWWPDEGDVLPTPSRLARNRMYWEGGRKTRPDRRPFALHRNCYAGIQRWGWLWSGDTDSTWKTLETQIMEGINAGLNGVPHWGTDIGRRLSSQPNFSCAGSNSARSVRRSDAMGAHGNFGARGDGTREATGRQRWVQMRHRFCRTWKTCTTKLSSPSAASSLRPAIVCCRISTLPHMKHTQQVCRLSAAWDWSFRRTRRHGKQPMLICLDPICLSRPFLRNAPPSAR
jgi:alpha-glucosidase/alpha-D-xyloside xylohydrolase